MSKNPTIRRFNMLNEQNRSHPDMPRIQEIINYAESRFWTILIYITSKANRISQSWYQQLLHQELIFVLSFVGIATSIGLTIDVPVIIRSLAGSISMLPEDQLPVGFDPDFLLTLDIDGSDAENKCRLVGRYECDWWNGKKPRTLDTAGILDKFSLQKCLEIHKSQYSSLIDSTSHSPAKDLSITNTGNPDGPAPKTKDRDILAESLQDLLETHQYSSSMLTSIDTQWNLDMRRASTLFSLHEAVIMKEMAGPSPNSNPPQSLPPTSYKWTWGEKLTDADVLALRRSGTRPRKVHSGYDLSLRFGHLSGEDSENPSNPTSHGIYDEVPQSVAPDYQFPGLSHFENNPLVYDPLGKIRQRINNQVPLAGTPVAAVNLTDDWSSDNADNVPLAGPPPASTLADQWLSDSDTSVPLAGPPPASYLDEWSSGGDTDTSLSRVKTQIPLAGPPPASYLDEWSSGGDTPPAPMRAQFNLAEEWPTDIDAPASMLARLNVEEEWPSDSDTPASLADNWPSDSDCAPANIPAETPVLNVAEEWQSESEEMLPVYATGTEKLADEWEDESGSEELEDEDEEVETVPNTQGSTINDPITVDDLWDSESDDIYVPGTGVAGEPSSDADLGIADDSNLVVSPSLITIPHLPGNHSASEMDDYFNNDWPAHDSDDRSSNATIEVPGGPAYNSDDRIPSSSFQSMDFVPVRRCFGPEHFTHLQDEMFEQHDQSDSESEGEE